MKKKDELFKLIRFGIVGVLNTLIDWAIFSLLFYLTPLGGSYTGKYAANAISFSLAVANSYVLNKSWTFKDKNKVEAGQIIRFILVNVASLVVSLVMLWISSDILKLNLIYPLKLLGMHFADEIKINVLLIKFIIVTPFVLLVNFIGNRMWVFNGKQ